jgi:FimV-like protein
MKKDELIDKFITNSLNEEEQKIFDDLMANDEDFQKEVRLVENLQKVAEFEDDAETRQLIADFEASHHPKPNKFNRKIWLVAASIALLAVLTYIFTDSKVDSQLLFAENFKPYQNVVHPIVRSAEQADLKTEAFKAYENGAYKRALELFDLLHRDTGEPFYLFYKANALLALNRPEEAITAFKNHLKTKDTLVEKTYWYLAMAYLKSGDTDMARKSLQEVVSKDVYKADKAKVLLDKLE